MPPIPETHDVDLTLDLKILLRKSDSNLTGSYKILLTDSNLIKILQNLMRIK